ncbi:MAG: c-type cytochrome [Pseudomonadota bacterium]
MRLAILALFCAGVLSACGGGDDSGDMNASEIQISMGRDAFRRACGACHMAAENGRNMVGPNLYDMIGREAGSLDGFSYSKALRSETFKWDERRMSLWIENPDALVTGHRMKSYTPVRDPAQRDAIIAYLASLAPAEAPETTAN